MGGKLLCILFAVSICSGSHDLLRGVQATAIDTRMPCKTKDCEAAGDKKEGNQWEPEVTFHILRLVEQLHSTVSTFEDRLLQLEKQVTEGDSKTLSSLDEKMEMYMTRLDKQVTEGMSNIVSSLDTMIDEKVVELYITRLENKIEDKLDTTKKSIVDDVLSRVNYNLIDTKDKIMHEVSEDLDDFRLVLLKDDQEALDKFEKFTKHVEETIEKASQSLIYSGLNATSYVTLSVLEMQNTFAAESKKSYSTFQTLTSELNSFIGEAMTLLSDAAVNSSFSAEQSKQNLLEFSENLETKLVNSSINLGVSLDHTVHTVNSLEKYLYDSINNQSGVLKDMSVHISTFNDLQIVLNLVLNQSCHKDMIKYPSATEKYMILLQDTTIPGTQILCDTATSGGGWIVIQRRVNFDITFYRDWESYKQGFGSITGDFWLGLEKIHKVTSSDKYELRVDVIEKNKNVYAQYSTFHVGSESEKYKLTLGSYSGTADDRLSYHNGMKFTTYDSDNDDSSSLQCAKHHGGAWWYDYCAHSNLNGNPEIKSSHGGSTKVFWSNISVNVTFSEMKIRRI